LFFSRQSSKTSKDDAEGSGKGVGGKGKGKGKGKPEGKGKGKGSSAGVGSTYADPGRPKIFKPTEQDRSHTGNIAEYFLRAEKTTPQPSVRMNDRIIGRFLTGAGL
jgi:hypothetical protein